MLATRWRFLSAGCGQSTLFHSARLSVYRQIAQNRKLRLFVVSVSDVEAYLACFERACFLAKLVSAGHAAL
jgi:hypothetical protein